MLKDIFQWSAKKYKDQSPFAYMDALKKKMEKQQEVAFFSSLMTLFLL
jgi:hypothetical protein